MVASNSKTKKFVGNNLDLNLSGDGHKNFLVVGNNCKVQLKDGFSSLQIVGDNCKVRVSAEGSGSRIIYVGNNGRIKSSGGFEEGNVRYVGNCGKFSSNNENYRDLKEENRGNNSEVNGKVRSHRREVKVVLPKINVQLPDINVDFNSLGHVKK